MTTIVRAFVISSTHPGVLIPAIDIPAAVTHGLPDDDTGHVVTSGAPGDLTAIAASAAADFWERITSGAHAPHPGHEPLPHDVRCLLLDEKDTVVASATAADDPALVLRFLARISTHIHELTERQDAVLTLSRIDPDPLAQATDQDISTVAELQAEGPQWGTALRLFVVELLTAAGVPTQHHASMWRNLGISAPHHVLVAQNPESGVVTLRVGLGVPRGIAEDAVNVLRKADLTVRLPGQTGPLGAAVYEISA